MSDQTSLTRKTSSLGITLSVDGVTSARLVARKPVVRHVPSPASLAAEAIFTAEPWSMLHAVAHCSVGALPVVPSWPAKLAPVLAQGTSSDTQIRGGAQGRTNMQGGASGSSDEEMDVRAAAPGEKSGVNAKAGAKGTVGAASGAHKGNTLPPGDPAAGGRRN